MKFDKVVWMLDPRFDFLLPWFEAEYPVSRGDILFVGSYHSDTRRGLHTQTAGNMRDGYVTFLEPEDINKLYAETVDPSVKTLVIPFTGAYLPSNENMVSFISTGELAARLNNKWQQYSFFVELQINTPRTWRVSGAKELKKMVEELLGKYGNLVLKKPELSGGYQMAAVTSMGDFNSWCEEKTSEFLESTTLISEYIPHIQSFAGMGLVRRDGSVIWYGATEQVLYHGLAYEGLIFPPFCTHEEQERMREMTCKVGDGLARLGYFGYFNVDFIVGSRGVQAVEINARFGFGTLLLACQSGERFWKVIRGEEKPKHVLEKRLILGKFKGREGQTYSGLTPLSDITHWYQSGEGEFRTFFCGMEKPETFEYGSFIGLFGRFLPLEAERDKVLAQFWDTCLKYYL